MLPLIVNNCYVFLEIGDSHTKRDHMYDLIQSLPAPNHNTMKLLFGHLHRFVTLYFSVLCILSFIYLFILLTVLTFILTLRGFVIIIEFLSQGY